MQVDEGSNRWLSSAIFCSAITELFRATKVELSVKKLEEQQTKETIKKYKNVDSGASLADILGPAMMSEKKPKKSKKDKKEE